MVKKRSQHASRKKPDIDHQEAAALADELSDRPYGSKKPEAVEEEPLERITFTMPLSMYEELESLARKRKRAKAISRSMAAIARDAVREYLDKQ